MRIVLCLLWLCAANESLAAIITAASCQEEAVQAAINAALAGDTIRVPAGSCEWTSTITLPSTKSLTLEGAGIDVTTIIDHASKTSPGILATIQVNHAPGVMHRITGFTFDGATQLGTGGPGFIQVSGTGNNPVVRIHHNKFYRLKTLSIVTTGSTIGVIDHNNFDLAYANAIRNHHSTWQGVGTSGHNSFAQPHSLGTDQAIFIEDNTFTWTGPTNATQAAIDPHNGARVVFRYNTLTNGYLASHGTEAQAARGPRQWEVYNNTLTGNTFTNFFIRGGPGVVFNNTSSGYTTGPNITLYRSFDDGGPPYGICDGKNAYDDNAPGGPFASGTVTSASGYTMTDNTKSWTAGQWTGYSIHNTTLNRRSYIDSHTSNSITADAPSNDPAWAWSVGHTYQIWKANQCLDQAGMGEGIYYTGSGTNPVLPATWNDAIIEGLYFWNNTLNGSAESPVIGSPGIQLLGTHILTTARPGYTPYTYPHPLVSGTPEPPEQTLGGYWPLDDGTGSSTAADNTTNGNDGTLNNFNVSTAWIGGRFGTALTFDGVNDYVEIPNDAALNFAADADFTILVWARTTTALASSYPAMVQKMDDGHANGWELIRASSGEDCTPTCNTWYGSIRTGGTPHVVASKIPLSDGAWHLLGLQRDGTTMRLFQDGVQLGTLTDASLALTVTNTFPLRFGRSNFAALPYYYTGALDDIQIYDYALTIEEIRQKYGVQRGKKRGRFRLSGRQIFYGE